MQVCQKGFRRKYDLRTHYKMHPGMVPPVDETPQSDQSTPVKRKVKKQTAGHVKMYPCSVCHKTFARKDYLAVHERLHTGLKPYKCSKCDKRFAQIPAWKCHEVYIYICIYH
jgi:KRAB domain-containing zinc finger protein